MAESSESVAGPAGEPIFEFDIACPQCEYNLRGLTERRCPECGNTFDPHAVLLAHRDNQPPLQVAWAVWNMHWHPLSFWQMEQVNFSRGPRRLQIFFGLIYLPILMTMICAALVFAFLQPRARVSSIGLSLVFEVISQSLGASLFVYMFCLVHGILCRVGLAMSKQRESVRAAKEIVGYGLIWLGPALLALTVSSPIVGSLFVTGGSQWAQAAAILALSAAAMTCVAWAITLYEGGKFASGGSLLVGLWCVVTNPFWYILGFAVIMVILG